MSLALPADLKKTGFFHSTVLTDVIRQLKELAAEMATAGFDEEALALKTTIADLQWQYEELIDKELTAQWPNGPRRALRTVKSSG